MKKRVVMTAEEIQSALEAMAATLCSRPGDGPWAVVGIRKGGENLAHRLAKLIAARTDHEPPLGMVDITLYRDDGFGPHDWPELGPTHIEFDLRKHTVVLVDDVLYTGRTVRAAMDALLDYGRPRALRLAVLVDRGLHELPIGGDAVGRTVQTIPSEHVDVRVSSEPSPTDAVVVRALEAATQKGHA